MHHWYARGHKIPVRTRRTATTQQLTCTQGEAVPSKDMLGAGVARNALAVRWYIRMTRIIHYYLSLLMKQIFPLEYARYRKAFVNALWTPDAGCWIGRAVLWKCQVDLHVDGGDGIMAICAIVNSGDYKPDTQIGNEHLRTSAVFPDLRLAFE